MTGLRIALVGAPDLSDVHHARRALAALAPDAHIIELPHGAVPTADLDGVWILRAPAGHPGSVHDPTISWALHHGLPVVGPLADDEGGARPARDFLTAAGTTWSSDRPAGTAGDTTIRSGGSPFAVLSVLPLAAEAGIHPAAVGFVEAARHHAGRRHTPAIATGGTLAPFADDLPRSYVHQMRTARYRWWRPVLALVAGIGTFVTLMLMLSLLWFVLDPSTLESTSTADIDPAEPVTMLISNLMLAALIPATLVATRIGHWRPMGKVWSVAGRIRWGWLTRASLVTTLLWGTYLALAWVLSGEQPTARPDHWGWLLLITVLTTPLQAAGEEVAFRGGIMQGVGAWISRPVLALVVSTVLSAATFALAHTSLDPWVLLDLAGMAAACCYLTWRTGGLEAAIVLHIVNNMVITIGLTLLGGIQDAYVTDQTTSTVGTAGLSVLATAIMTAVLLWLARRSGIAPRAFGAPALSAEAPAAQR
ncbi:hypothetical protein ASG73_14090 [Janibacter sp. Soil728]|uniref:CPBP family intramembrane glutamic endopeptidase n=1 Tax=Janibacter sp. Soil728 TaxID=1736393 RepID=UPI0006F35E2F|nr:CPBP family intramembrane glutamic endopeptidase [Janibacter sp. Soil728]KRE35819.1 hypothetical protein ASG73_14090 [Janibacter sp. Soil728]